VFTEEVENILEKLKKINNRIEELMQIEDFTEELKEVGKQLKVINKHMEEIENFKELEELNDIEVIVRDDDVIMVNEVTEGLNEVKEYIKELKNVNVFIEKLKDELKKANELTKVNKLKELKEVNNIEELIEELEKIKKFTNELNEVKHTEVEEDNKEEKKRKSNRWSYISIKEVIKEKSKRWSCTNTEDKMKKDQPIKKYRKFSKWLKDHGDNQKTVVMFAILLAGVDVSHLEFLGSNLQLDFNVKIFNHELLPLPRLNLNAKLSRAAESKMFLGDITNVFIEDFSQILLQVRNFFLQ